MLWITDVKSSAGCAGRRDHPRPAGHAGDDADDDADPEQAGEEEDGDEEYERYPLLSFANTDMAFSGDVLVAGSYHGFNVYRLQDGGVPELIDEHTSSLIFVNNRRLAERAEVSDDGPGWARVRVR